MNVRAKFVCVKVEPQTEGFTVTFEAVISGPGNESWSKWTPSGNITMYVTNPDVTFEAGKEYCVDFSLAE